MVAQKRDSELLTYLWMNRSPNFLNKIQLKLLKRGPPLYNDKLLDNIMHLNYPLFEGFEVNTFTLHGKIESVVPVI